jgi:hypothetical protein
LTAAQFPLVAILLALECDPNGPGLEALFELIRVRSAEGRVTVEDVLRGTEGEPREPVDPRSALELALIAAGELRPGLLLDPGAWLPWANTVRRFSFRQHHVP